MTSTLYSIRFSPWSLKARCALRHHGIEPQLIEYKPLVDELPMRWRLRKFSGRLTVPVLSTDDGVYTDSFDIARYADRVGSGSPLIPSEQAQAVADWNARSERLASAARARTLIRSLDSPESLRESLPRALASLPVAMARGTTRLFCAKYGIRADDYDAHGEVVRQELDALRAALASGGDYLLGDLSYADFVMGIALQLVQPLPESPMGPASMRVSTEPELIAAYPEVFAWRDRLHARHGLLPQRKRKS